jgi:putative N-acetyltransferase (TIGR04045 family)
VIEQGIFPSTDRDRLDERSDTIHLVGSTHERVVGAVRLYPVDPVAHVWLGDRLAVDPEFRVYQLGSDLVRLAVSTAADHGGQIMKAHIQVANVRFFERLGWTTDGPEETYHGRPHQPMAIDLPRAR